jgi:hypothetical protein
MFVVAGSGLQKYERSAPQYSFLLREPTIAVSWPQGRRWIDSQTPATIVVRSPNDAYDVFWQQAANYHDPRIFYLSGTRGWTIGREQDNVTLLATAAPRRGFSPSSSSGRWRNDAWLGAHASLVWSGKSGRIWVYGECDDEYPHSSQAHG